MKYIPSLPVLVAIPAAIIGSRLGAASKARAEAMPSDIKDHYALLESVGDDQLLVRREADKWVVLHREPKSKWMSSRGSKVLYDGHVFMVSTITHDASGMMELFMLWRIK